MQVSRYFHIRPNHTRGGATILVTGDTEHVGQVDVQVAFCSRKDVFCKKTGREEAKKAAIKVVALRYLPRELGSIMAQMEKRVKMISEFPFDFTFAIKYFLPKE